MTRIDLPDDPGQTTSVCLDCAGSGPVPGLVRVIRWTSQWAANGWVRTHRLGGHQVVTVPGWPDRETAAALARAHVQGQASAQFRRAAAELDGRLRAMAESLGSVRWGNRSAPPDVPEVSGPDHVP